jgi:MFS family permease
VKSVTDAEQAGSEPERKGLRSSFRALENPIYRKYFIGQALTRLGSWTQDIAQSWFVFEQTGSGTAVGVLLACEFLPILLLSLWAGSLADRHSKRRLLAMTQALLVVLAVVLAGVVAVGASLTLLFVIAVLRGVVLAVNITVGTSFLSEIVSKNDMRSASSLNGMIFNLGRALGALLAAVLIQTISISVCFLVNAAVYSVFLFIVLRIHPNHVNAATPQSKAGIREGLRYSWGVPELRAAVVLMFGVGLLAYNSQVFFTALADDVYNSGLNTYSWLMVIYSVGFVICSIIGAAGGAPTNRMVLSSAAALGSMILLTAVVAPVPVAGMAVVALWGAANGMFGSRINTTVQLNSSPEMKGRVMALWSMVVWGTTPLGGPFIGFVAEHFGAQASLFVTAVGVFGCCLYAWTVLRNRLEHVAAH